MVLSDFYRGNEPKTWISWSDSQAGWNSNVKAVNNRECELRKGSLWCSRNEGINYSGKIHCQMPYLILLSYVRWEPILQFIPEGQVSKTLLGWSQFTYAETWKLLLEHIFNMEYQNYSNVEATENFPWKVFHSILGFLKSVKSPSLFTYFFNDEGILSFSPLKSITMYSTVL